jgi:hypothetical protein
LLHQLVSLFVIIRAIRVFTRLRLKEATAWQVTRIARMERIRKRSKQKVTRLCLGAGAPGERKLTVWFFSDRAADYTDSHDDGHPARFSPKSAW